MLSIKHSQLVLVENNRTVARQESDILERAASIRAQGILQNIVVADAGNGTYWLAAGEGRYLSVQHLIDNGELTTDFEYPAKLVDVKDVPLVRLAENGHREDLHPVDEYLAYSEAVSRGHDVNAIAKAQGVSTRHVNKILKLAAVSPIILDAYRRKELNAKHIEFFALINDKEQQEKVYEENKDEPHHISFYVKSSLFSTEAPIWTFAGEEYLAKGGELEEDLFSVIDADDNGNRGLIKDDVLIKRIASKKLKAELKKYTGFGWGEITYNDPYDYLDNTYEDSEVIFRSDLADAHKSKLGVVVGIDCNGEIEVIKNIAKDSATHQAIIDEYRKSIELENANDGTDDDGTDDEEGQSQSKGKTNDYTQSLKDDLRIVRNLCHMTAFIESPQVAADLAMWQVCEQALSQFLQNAGYSPFPLGITHKSEVLEFPLNEELNSKIASAIDSISSDWAKGSTRADRFELFTALSQEEKLAIFGAASALSSHCYVSHSNGALSMALERVGMDYRQYWTPTRSDFFKRIPLGDLLEIGQALFGDDWVEENKEKSRGDLSKLIESAFNSTELNDEQLSYVKTYLPKDFLTL